MKFPQSTAGTGQSNSQIVYLGEMLENGIPQTPGGKKGNVAPVFEEREAELRELPSSQFSMQ